MPILLLSITEKPYHETQLLKNPCLYKENAGNKRITWKYFLAWITLAVYHSITVYFFGYMIYTNDLIRTSDSKQQLTDLVSFGTFMIHNIVFVVTVKLWIIARYRTIIFTLAILGSVFSFVASTLLWNIVPFCGALYMVYTHLLTSTTFWISNLLICIAALIPDCLIIALKMFNIKVRPTDTISDGWNRLFRDPKNPSLNRSTTTSESTYL